MYLKYKKGMVLHWYLTRELYITKFLSFQGGIYSESAVANYPNGEEFFKTATPRVPAKRLGTPEEVTE